MTKRYILLTSCITAITCCMYLNACLYNHEEPAAVTVSDSGFNQVDIAIADSVVPDTNQTGLQPIPYDNVQNRIDVKNVQPQQVVDYGKTLLGVPYKYASMDPKEGFDCSGFISYVFNHFDIAVPRSSVDFTHVPTGIPEQQAKPGDLILFTGTDSTLRIVGHMGIVTENNLHTGIQFIHSSSGKANGVTISPLEGYYRGRFVKVIRIF